MNNYYESLEKVASAPVEWCKVAFENVKINTPSPAFDGPPKISVNPTVSSSDKPSRGGAGGTIDVAKARHIK